MKHPSTRALFEYWLEIKGDRLTPYRSELDPRSISDLLDSTFILENLGEGNVRFRLAGTKLCDRFGMELSGMSALSPWTESSRSEISAMLDRVVAEPCVAQISCAASVGGHRIEAEFVYMPIRSDFGDISRVLGCCYELTPRARAGGYSEPPRYQIEAVTIIPIEAGAQQVADYGAPLPGFGEDADAFSGKAANTTPILRAIDGGAKRRNQAAGDRPNLRVVKND